MKTEFFKYHGTGNDFVIIDNRGQKIKNLSSEKIKKICDRHFGIGADGLILLENESGYDFRMVYFNSDGKQSTMCGNGGRCIAAFANHLGIIDRKCSFMAIDGPHQAYIDKGLVSLKMKDVTSIESLDNGVTLDTGSPHFVCFKEQLDNINVDQEGRKIRYSEPFAEEGINVNFVSEDTDTVRMRTYERGVEGETLSCGTGVTAAALAVHHKKLTNREEVIIETKGGVLSVSFKYDHGKYSEIWLKGPAEYVFKGEIEW